MSPFEVNELAQRVTAEVSKVVVAQEDAIRSCLAALFARGHVKLEGPSGSGKTVLARTLLEALGLRFARLQVSSDAHSDLIAIAKRSDTHALLVDELNRGAPRSQASLLEILEDAAVSTEGRTIPMPDPFWTIATLNPSERAGTYSLPDELIERFACTVRLDSPGTAVEEEIARRARGMGASSTVQPVSSPARILEARAFVASVHVGDAIIRYAAALVTDTRAHPEVERGASTRATIHLLAVARALAALESRDFVVPDDVKECAQLVLAPRLLLTPEAEIGGVTVDSIVRQILDRTRAPGAAETVRPSRLRTSPFLSEPPTARPADARGEAAEVLPTPPLAETLRPQQRPSEPPRTTLRPHASPLARAPDGEDR
ncbi:MAG: MoxR family ATPase [Deltaproteobacteria bacterium]|nr:MoxR family ATPase [Deltaproteobacteria bacterium]